MKSKLDRLIALICAVTCAVTGSLPIPVLARRLHAEARLGGAATEWRLYDARGRLIERQIDTNGDGRPDVAEYYRDGALLRRDSDRDFNGVTDLVEDFDAATQQRVRSIVDEDYDGTADLLVLFRDGKAVVSERVASSRAAARPNSAHRGSGSLVALKNPFGNHPAADSPLAPIQREPWTGAVASSGLLASIASLPAPAASQPALPRAARGAPDALRSLRSPRGPPLA